MAQSSFSQFQAELVALPQTQTPRGWCCGAVLSRPRRRWETNARNGRAHSPERTSCYRRSSMFLCFWFPKLKDSLICPSEPPHVCFSKSQLLKFRVFFPWTTWSFCYITWIKHQETSTTTAEIWSTLSFPQGLAVLTQRLCPGMFFYGRDIK